MPSPGAVQALNETIGDYRIRKQKKTKRKLS
jgi:hypothetical protein